MYSVTERGEKIRWSNSSSRIDLYINASQQYSPYITQQDTENATLESLQKWNAISPMTINPIVGGSKNFLSRSASLSFSQNSAYFGSGVLAVTALNYDSDSGTIIDAEILVNDTPFKSTIFTPVKNFSSGPYAYIGDVIAHEVGHLLGLNHSETQGSAMVFSIFKDQHKLHSDDHMGVLSLYDRAQGSKIKGRVVTSADSPLFGVNVELIDVSTNNVVAGVFTDDQGHFEFKGVSAQKSYVLHLSPMKASEYLTQEFVTVRTQVCAGESFVPSFFSKCGGRSRGRAQVFTVSENHTLNLGDIGIKCVNNLAPSYMRLKLSGASSFAQGVAHTAYDYAQEFKQHTSFIGQFSLSDVESQAPPTDILEFDLRSLDLSGYQNPHVRFSLSTVKLGSAYGLGVEVSRNENDSVSVHSYSTDPVSGKLILDYDVLKEMSMIEDENLFKLKITPIGLNSTEKTEIFAAPSIMTSKELLYFVMMEIVELDDDLNIVRDIAINDAPYENNSSCLEGEQTQVATTFSPLSAGSDGGNSLESAEVMSCATVGEREGAGSGPMSYFAGLFATLMLLRFLGKRDDFFV